jgi:TetR/AcrR family transcriptional regulator, regulator of cefoperazone and chloramphenicol sensitivity
MMSDRPPNTNPESARTRERLLDAAERLFAERGFRSASVRDITREASCNIASVNYHFGGKQSLYREVFLRRLRDLRGRRLEGIQRALGAQPTLERLLASFADSFVDPLVGEGAGRLWTLLVAQELIDPQLPPETFRGEMIEPVEQALASAMLEVCPGLDREDAALTAQSLVGQLVHLVKLQRCGGGVGGRDLASLLDHTVRFTAAGLRSLQRVSA